MTPARWLPAIILLGSIGSTARVEGQEAAPADFRLLVWYDANSPAETFQHRAYDLRKKPFPGADVDAWIEKTRADFPNYRVKLREVRLADWAGSSEGEKLLRAVQHEVGEVYPPVRRLERSIPRPVPIVSPGRPTPLRTLPGRVPGLGAGNSIGATGPSTPFPVPYPKPHP